MPVERSARMASPAQASLDLLVRVADDPAWAREEAKRVDAYNRDNGARYGDDPIPVSLKPNFISAEQRTLLTRAARRVTGALEAFVDAFLEDPSLQEAWDVSDEELESWKASLTRYGLKGLCVTRINARRGASE
jgi:hypothetical protein